MNIFYFYIHVLDVFHCKKKSGQFLYAIADLEGGQGGSGPPPSKIKFPKFT